MTLGLRLFSALRFALLFVSLSLSAKAQTYTVVANFDGIDGIHPNNFVALVQGLDGSLYGTAGNGGTNSAGTVFRMSPDGAITVLYNFCSQSNCADGKFPVVGLTLGFDGNIYGGTYAGGAYDFGTIFKVDPLGNVTKLHDLEFYTNGNSIVAQGADGNLYVTSSVGGDSNLGVAYKLSPSGVLTLLHSFCVTDCLDGTEPTQLIALPDGTFYGASRVGGAYGGGTIFRMSASGKVTVLYSFCSQANCADGSHPNALTLASDGNLYGTTTDGGTSKAHCVYGCGTIFKFDPGRGLTTIYNDCALVGCVDISYVYTGLIQGSDGNLYGTSAAGGGNKNGTAFQITPSGKLTILHSFSSADYQVDGPFIQHTNGYLYAVDPWTGTYSDGMIFDISMNLNPFASLLRPWGKVGQATRILGQGFLGTSSVSFNGTPAAFATHSDTVLSVIVPAGATTGPVSVITSTGTLTSNRNFQVLPQVLTFDPPSGPVGTVVTINGVSLTQAQAVAFGNRISSTFTVNSDTQITATVPASAKTGAIWIRTVGGAATSPATFTVTP